MPQRQRALYCLTVSSVGLLAVLASGCESSLSKDLDDFCKVVTEVERDGSMTPSDKMAKVDSRKAEFVRPLPLGTVNVWEELAKKSGEERYGYLLAVAKSEGKTNYKCPAFNRLSNAVEVEKSAKETAAKEAIEKAHKEAAEKAQKEEEAAKQKAAEKPTKKSAPEKADKKKPPAKKKHR